uniref:Calcium dependent secretion activator 2 n=1 Tax=Salmo trutta TaxID=8032 RepID=A0A673XPF5_SALTR
MLDPSSSEDSGGEINEDTQVPKDPPTSSGQGGKLKKQPPADQAQAENSPVEDQEKNEQERLQKEEAERKSKLQMYVFVLRCIAYPFNAKQPTDMARRQQKLNKQQLQAVKDHFQAFLNGDTQMVADEAFCNAVRSYYEGFLKSERVSRMVQSGGCSACDFRDVFKKNIERRVRSLPKIDGLSKETVLSSWIAKYDTIYRGDEDLRHQPQRMHLSAVSEMILSKEQLYEMFQQILGIKKFEHQLLYNACQLDNVDEQAAQIRSAFTETEAGVGGALLLFHLKTHSIYFNFSWLEPFVSFRWGTQGDFTTTHPLPMVKVKLFTESTGVLALEDKELGRVILNPTTNGPKQAELHKMVVSKNSQDAELKIQLAIRMDKPPNMKHSGYLYALGQRVWKRWKRRYFVLVQVSQYTFAMCSYREKKSEPHELMQLEGYTVDYSDPQPGLQGGRVFFNAVKEGDLVVFANDDEQDRMLWVQAMYRATGQSYKPIPPTQNCRAGNSQPYAPISLLSRQGVEELISAVPCRFDHAALFPFLQKQTLQHRMNDSFSCLGWFSPGQVFVLDEYCARYGVRGCHRHLSYLRDLMEYSGNNILVDPTLLHYSYAFCASHIHGNRPDGMCTVTEEEGEQFEDIRGRLLSLLDNQIIHFRYCFPFGRPDGALKATLSLLERVLMKDITTPVPPDEMKKVVQKCLEKAALVNYSQLTEYAQIEADAQAATEKRLEDMMRLGELCIEVLQQNDEHHSEAFSWWPEMMAEHAETFMSLYTVDMDGALQVQPVDSWDSFPLFQLLNNFLRYDPHLCNGMFHKHLQDLFIPLVVRYIDLMESSIAQSIHCGFEQETWQSVNNGSETSEDLFWKLDALQMFVLDLHWPEPEFAKHLEQRLKLMASNMMEACVKRTKAAFDSKMQKASKSTDFRVSLLVCTMFNVLIDAKKQCSKLCVLDSGLEVRPHSTAILCSLTTQTDHTFPSIHFAGPLDAVLSKLSRYDEGTLFSSIFSFTVSSSAFSKPGMDLADTYITFVRQNQDILRDRVNEEMYIEKLFDQWYTSSMKAVCVWLTDRLDLQLHMYQLKTLIKIVKKTYRDFRLQGVLDGTLNNKSYETVYNRLTVEEATVAVKAGDGLQGITMRDSDEEDG